MSKAPISPSGMRRLGWVRVDERPWTKARARWRHVSGWTLAHCGHPTALWPWALVRPDGRMVLTGVLGGHPPTSGRAWPNLRAAVEWLALHLHSGRELRADEGPPRYFER